jgi:hypothetical protein
MKLKIVTKGGSGSGHFNHEGRPGEQGGSLPGTGGGAQASSTSNSFEVHGSKVSVKPGRYENSFAYTVTSSDGVTYTDYERSEEQAKKKATTLAKLFNSPEGRAAHLAASSMASRADSVAELKNVFYRQMKNEVIVADIDGFYGNTQAAIELDDMNRYGFKTVGDFVAALDKGGASKAKQKRSPKGAGRSYSVYD